MDYAYLEYTYLNWFIIFKSIGLGFHWAKSAKMFNKGKLVSSIMG